MQEVELELRAAWQDLARWEAAHHARLEAAEAAVRETSRSAQACTEAPAPLSAPPGAAVVELQMLYQRHAALFPGNLWWLRMP